MWESLLGDPNETTNVTTNVTPWSKTQKLKTQKLHKSKCWKFRKHEMPKSSNTKVIWDQVHDYNLKSISKVMKKVKIVKLETWLSERSQPDDAEVKAQKHGKTKT